MDDLDYEKHLSYYRDIFGSKSEYAERRAQKIHALEVFNSLRDWFAKAINIAKQLTKENAKYYMTHGSPIFKAVRNKRSRASYTPLRRSPKSPKGAGGEDAEQSKVETADAAPQ